MGFLTSILIFIQSNQMLVAGLGLGSAGLISFWFKDMPKMLFNFLKRELTTELIIQNSDLAFYNILKWIEGNYPNKNFRRLKTNNGLWGTNEQTTTSIGYGFHYIKFRKNKFLITLSKESSNQTTKEKETMTIRKWGRSRKILDTFIKETALEVNDPTKIKIFKMENCWQYIRSIEKRKLNTVFIEKNKMDLIINSLNNFLNREQWYIDNGIPYQMGLLLYGSHGTGKTSLIKALAGYLNFPIFYLSPQKLNKIEEALSRLPNKCLVIIEDIDSSSVTHSREKEKNNSEFENIISEIKSTGLSEILNALDGLFSAHGRILITTTNHIENLDPALIRPGRIDLQIEIGYVNDEILESFLNNFFPNNEIDLNKINIKNNTTVAELQNMVLLGNSIEEIIENISVKKEIYLSIDLNKTNEENKGKTI